MVGKQCKHQGRMRLEGAGPVLRRRGSSLSSATILGLRVAIGSFAYTIVLGWGLAVFCWEKKAFSPRCWLSNGVG